MLKSKIENVLEDGTTMEREIMILEEGETLESVRNPEKRKEALALVESLKVEFDTNCTPRVPGNVNLITSKVVITYKQDSNQIFRPIPFEKAKKKRSGTDAVLTEKYTAMRKQFFQLLLDHFLPTCPPTQEEQMAEIHQLLHEGVDTIDADTCYNSTFVVFAVHKALSRNKIPMIDCQLWSTFAHNYTVIMMGS